MDPEVITRLREREQEIPVEQTSFSSPPNPNPVTRKYDEEKLLLDDNYDFQDDPGSILQSENGTTDRRNLDTNTDSERRQLFPESSEPIGTTNQFTEHQPYSKLQPYPQSQNNVSPTSALNLQRYPDDSDQLIV